MKRACPSNEFDPDAALKLLRQLRRESGDNFGKAASTLKTILQNVLEHPDEERYRTVRLGNPTFHARLGQFGAGPSLLRMFGFEDASSSEEAQAGASANVTHLALPVASPETLAHGLVLVEAALQAAALVETEEGGGPTQSSGTAVTPSSSGTASAPAAAAVGSGAGSGKRPLQPAAARPPVAGASMSSGAVGSEGGASSEMEIGDVGDFTAAGIDAFFGALLGTDGGEITRIGLAAFGRLYGAARDAHRVVTELGDTAA